MSASSYRLPTIGMLFLLLLIGSNLLAQSKKTPSPIIYENGKLSYTPDSLGNTVLDFSYAGYMAGEQPIPNVEIKIVVPPTNEDATRLIQDALDYLGNMQPDASGFRGAVLLSGGDYKISGNLLLRNSGVVLRGSGVNTTRLIATGKDRRIFIRVEGKNDRTTKDTIEIADAYLPVNSFTLNVTDGKKLKVGDNIVVCRPSTKEWIERLGTHHFGGGITALGWKPGSRNIYQDRKIIRIKGNTITLDAPITTALDKQYGGGYVFSYVWNGRISNVGVENLTCISEYDTANPKDEAHAWTAVSMENIIDGWVRNCTFEHFAGSAVAIQKTGKRITVENCQSLKPVSEIGGQRRYTFFTSGQQCLFQRLYAENGYHDFAVGFCAAGPNAFVQCHSFLPYNFSGAIDSWASGVLFDIVNIDGNALSFKNRMEQAQGAGWSAANSVFWQCSASLIENFAPPTAQNYSFGSWSEFSGNGYWGESNNHVQPRSLYYAQLAQRLNNYTDRADLLPIDSEASSSPPVHTAMELTKKAYTPALTLSEWIDSLCAKNTIPITPGRAPVFKRKESTEEKSEKTAPLQVKNGWIVRGDAVQTGQKHDIQWWSGSVRPDYLEKTARPHITRFVPGRTGIGLTDNIDSVALWMRENHILALDHNYGLWYDRRRDDHERIRRINGEVWPPFYEQPFARSGEGIAYDGLSKYDLSKYNDWYWMRLTQFADLADRDGLILLHQNYFQHNIIEAGAHWTDSPWRPANNINNTGFPEPVPYAGDKRIFLAEQFYDINHPVRRELHRAYIRQCLNNFKDNSGVIQLISAEYTGPLHFVEFWLDVIAEWEAETGRKQLIALSATKDVQDAVLADPVRSKIVDVIDIRYWFHREDGTTYAPEGGQNLAPRQHARLTKPGKVSFESVYRAVKEYREAYPGKAVTYYASNYPQMAWASFMAGGSLACIPPVADTRFYDDASAMQPMSEFNEENRYVSGNKDKGFIIYSESNEIELDFSNIPGKYALYWLNPQSGNITEPKIRIKGNGIIRLNMKEKIAWLKKE